jgi:hypothetical protein
MSPFVTAKFPHPCVVCGTETRCVRTRDGKFCCAGCDPENRDEDKVESVAETPAREVTEADRPSTRGTPIPLEQGEGPDPMGEAEARRAAALCSGDDMGGPPASTDPPRDPEEEPSLIELLVSARPKETRRAGLAFVTHLAEGIERAKYASGHLRLANAGEGPDLEAADELAGWFELRGSFEGLALRLSSLKGTRFASVLEDCLDLADRLVDEHLVPLPASVAIALKKGWTRKELARRIREELRPKAKAPATAEEKTARLSEDGKYRTLLERIWDRSRPAMVVFGLNPSTADADKDDQTIRRSRTLAKRFGRGSLAMLNLYAWRSTDPAALDELNLKAAVGPETDDVIQEVLQRAQVLVVCAWGSLSKPRDKARAAAVLEMIRARGHEPMCFGFTKDRSPRHPSRLPNDVDLVDYRGEELGVRWFRCATCQDVGCSNCL